MHTLGHVGVGEGVKGHRVRNPPPKTQGGVKRGRERGKKGERGHDTTMKDGK